MVIFTTCSPAYNTSCVKIVELFAFWSLFYKSWFRLIQKEKIIFNRWLRLISVLIFINRTEASRSKSGPGKKYSPKPFFSTLYFSLVTVYWKMRIRHWLYHIFPGRTIFSGPLTDPPPGPHPILSSGLCKMVDLAHIPEYPQPFKSLPIIF